MRRERSLSLTILSAMAPVGRSVWGATMDRVETAHSTAPNRYLQTFVQPPAVLRESSVHASRRGVAQQVHMDSASTSVDVMSMEGVKAENDAKEKKPRKPNYKIPVEIPEDTWPSYPNFSFTVNNECSCGTNARTGTLVTPHGPVETPAFIFCATKAAMKSISVETMKACGSQIMLSNTYHLLVQPGSELISKMGGLQEATCWRGPMLTDSGGYQIFSMGHGSVSNEIKGRRGAQGGQMFEPSLVHIGEKGARFKSYYDCSIKTLTPESSIQIQRELGADFVVVLDECTPFHVDKEYTEKSMQRTHRWALRSLKEFIAGDDETQALYGIVQGGVYPDLREEAVKFINSQPFFGIAIGGSLGADKVSMHEVVTKTMSMVRRDRPVHLLGIGGIADIFHGVRQGIDTFDCVHPTRLGRHGGALVKAKFWDGVDGRDAREHVNLLKGYFKDDMRPIEDDCGCPTCKGGYTRAYINHLGNAGEMLCGMLISQHNVYFMNELMTCIRRAIREGTLDEEEDRWLRPGLRARDYVAAKVAAEADVAAAAASKSASPTVGEVEGLRNEEEGVTVGSG